MKPVFQRHLRGPSADPDAEPGDCMAAALASVLELPLEAVPNFATVEGPLGWWDAMRGWLRDEGADLACVSSPADVTWHADTPPERRLVLAAIPSPRGGWSHTVVADERGVVVHDPYPGPTSCAGGLLGRLGCLEVWAIVPPYDPFPAAPADREPAELERPRAAQ